MLLPIKFISLKKNSFNFQALNGEGGYGEPRDMHGPIMSEPYYEPYVVRHPLDYGMARTYSGGYIGPGASKVSTVGGFFFFTDCRSILLLLLVLLLLLLPLVFRLLLLLFSLLFLNLLPPTLATPSAFLSSPPPTLSPPCALRPPPSALRSPPSAQTLI